MDAFWRFWRYFLLAALLGIAFVYVPVKLYDDNGFRRVERIRAEVEAIEAKNRQLRRENEALRKQIRALRSDPDYIENIARNEMGMVGPDEIVFQF